MNDSTKNNNGHSPEGNANFKIPKEKIGEILNATKNNPELIDYMLRGWVKNPRRIAVNYRGTYCRLLDHHILPEIGFPLYVSRVNGSVLPESWGERRKRGVPLA